MSDPVKTSFPPMGPNGISDSVVNVSGQRSPYTTLVPVGGVPGGAGIDGPTAPAGAAQHPTEINAETLGPCCKPQTTLFFPNAADHEQTGRNVKILPSRAGTSDFWAQRAQ